MKKKLLTKILQEGLCILEPSKSDDGSLKSWEEGDKVMFKKILIDTDL